MDHTLSCPVVRYMELSYVYLKVAHMVEKLKIKTLKFLFLEALEFLYDKGLV